MLEYEESRSKLFNRSKTGGKPIRPFMQTAGDHPTSGPTLDNEERARQNREMQQPKNKKNKFELPKF